MTEEEIPNVQRAAASRLGIHLTIPQAIAVLGWWHMATQQLRFSSGWVGTVGVRAYHRSIERSGLAARGVATAERLDCPESDRFSQDLVLHTDWLSPVPMGRHLELAQDLIADRVPRGWDPWLTELDVNGQFHSAASIDLGHGDPELIITPRTLDGYLSMPGYVRLARKPSEMPLFVIWRAYRRLQEGSVLTTNQAQFLTRRGIELDASEVLVWPKHRRHLDAWAALFRHARTVLADAAASGNLAAQVALGLVKETVNVTVGGWMRSEEKNGSDLMNRAWSDRIITEGGIRALISVEHASVAGAQVVGMRRDAAWFLGPRNYEPEGLTIDRTFHPTGKNGKLGKWKRTRSVPLTQGLIDAQETQSPEMMVRAIKAAWQAINE